MADTLAAYIKHGFPDENDSESGFVTTIEYVGPASVLSADRPAAGDVWGDYLGTVSSAHYTPLEKGNHGDDVPHAHLVVICQLNYGGDGTPTGTVKETTYEIDWVSIERSLYEHPEFSVGGLYELDDEMKQEVETWKEEKDSVARKNFEYWTRDKNGLPIGSVASPMEPNSTYFAQYLAAGVETWVDYAPVARKNRTYVGGPPPSSEAGQKDTPTGFPNLPSGYEWRKSSDRALRGGGQTRWNRGEEWLGAKTVLVDKDELFL